MGNANALFPIRVCGTGDVVDYTQLWLVPLGCHGKQIHACLQTSYGKE